MDTLGRLVCSLAMFSLLGACQRVGVYLIHLPDMFWPEIAGICLIGISWSLIDGIFWLWRKRT